MRDKNQNANVAEEVLVGTEKEMPTDIAKCPGCGANLIFFPELQKLKCEHCGTQQEIHSVLNTEQSFSDLFAKTNQWADETHVFGCNNCGAKQTLSKTEIATTCSFCGTSNIVETKELSGLKPTAVVPFKISKETAISKVIAWVKKKLFAPKKFKRAIDPQDVSGTYTPAFTFDTGTFSFYHGRLGKYRYVTKTVNGKTVTERKTEYFNINGTFSMFFDDILIQASTVIKQKTINSLMPFNTNDSKAYTKEFLHGYSAAQYTKDGTYCWTEAKKLIDKSIRASILRKYTYDFVESLTISTNCRNTTYKYVLLPVYIGHLNWKKKVYNFFVNGANGRITGKTPVSTVKVLIAVGIALAALVGLSVLAWLFGYN